MGGNSRDVAIKREATYMVPGCDVRCWVFGRRYCFSGEAFRVATMMAPDEDAECGGCNSTGELDEDGLCEFCADFESESETPSGWVGL